MPDTIPADSVGLVSPTTLHIDTPITLECGRSLQSYDLIYESYGELNDDGSNAVLICHAL
ncbi:MAG: homoserine O-acetyltransferase, partial [Gammaproteobacteria bacterium]